MEKEGCIMAKYKRYTIDVSAPLTPEQREMLEKLKDREPEPDEDCPELTPEQIAQFKRVSADRRMERTKQTVTIRLSPKALSKARSLGSGYTSVLSRILEAALSDNETIRKYL